MLSKYLFPLCAQSAMLEPPKEVWVLLLAAAAAHVLPLLVPAKGQGRAVAKSDKYTTLPSGERGASLDEPWPLLEGMSRPGPRVSTRKLRVD